MKKISTILIIFFSFSLINPSFVSAKLLPQARNTGSSVSKSKPVSSGISIFPKLRRDKKALNISFGNLQNADSIEYTLIYKTNGKDEGTVGTVPLNNNSHSTEILFGTCSSGVCTYHTNISNMRLEVKSTLKSGKKTVRKYKIRI